MAKLQHRLSTAIANRYLLNLFVTNTYLIKVMQHTLRHSIHPSGKEEIFRK